jgi:lipoate-protein ligase A
VTWPVSELRGSAADLHTRPLLAERAIELLVLDRTAIVLGSTQPEEHIDGAAAAAVGVEVARRRSGGGAVLLVPGRDLWLDITIPATDPLWDDDVGRAFQWVGQAWVGALARLAVADGATVHAGPPLVGHWGRRICFAGVGAGEVVVGGRKVVGISQRRTREAARFQCAVMGAWDPVPILGLLALEPEERVRGLTDLADVALAVELPPTSLVYALLASLPE